MTQSRFPDSLVLIFAIVVLAQLASYVLPAGEYERRTELRDGHEMTLVVPGTFHRLSSDPGAGGEEAAAPRLPWYAALTSIPKGFGAAADIIFFVFLVGGVIGVVRATGAIDALIGTAIRRFGGRPLLLVAGTLTLFAIGSSTIGMAEEYMPFVPVLVSMCLALRMDAIVAMGLVYLGAGIGYGAAALNPFTVFIAQDISGLPRTSGAWYRWLLLLAFLLVAVQHVMAYARRIQRDPSRSLVKHVDYSFGFEMPSDTRMTAPRAAILLAFAAGIGFFAWGAKVHEWYVDVLGAIFLGIGLVAAAIGRLSPNRTAREFCTGAAELTSAALLIGFARTIQVVLTDAKVIDTVVHGIAETLPESAPAVSASLMLLVQSAINLFIPSGSGQAFVTMPIMAPLADLVGVTRQTAVLCYQIGDGLTNMIVPTNALLMGMLALGRIPFTSWARFALSFLVKAYVVALLAVIAAVWFGYR